MKRFMPWLATAATLTFVVPVQGAQNDPRLDSLFSQLQSASNADEAECPAQADRKSE